MKATYAGVPKSKRTDKGVQTESADPNVSPSGSYRYKPYPKTKPTPEPERNLPVDAGHLNTTANAFYRGDREFLECIVDLKAQTAAILEYVNRTETQLHSAYSALERIESYVRHWEGIGEPQRPSGDEDPRKSSGDKVTLAPDESDKKGARYADIFLF